MSGRRGATRCLPCASKKAGSLHCPLLTVTSVCEQAECAYRVAGEMPQGGGDARVPGRPYCNFYEGESRRRLNYGSYDDGVRAGLDFLRDELAPVLREVIRASGGIPLRPLISRALRMGDELHSRNTAATILFTRELMPHLVEHAVSGSKEPVQTALRFFSASDYSFLRLSMAAAKAMADAAAGVPGSSVVTAMTISCRNFAIRVSGLGDQWFTGPLPEASCKLFDGFTAQDVEWIGGESHITADPASLMPGDGIAGSGSCPAGRLRCRRRRRHGGGRLLVARSGVHAGGCAARRPGGEEHQDEPDRQRGDDGHGHDGELPRGKRGIWVHGDLPPPSDQAGWAKGPAVRARPPRPAAGTCRGWQPDWPGRTAECTPGVVVTWPRLNLNSS